jgi:hypothetical protein
VRVRWDCDDWEPQRPGSSSCFLQQHRTAPHRARLLAAAAAAERVRVGLMMATYHYCRGLPAAIHRCKFPRRAPFTYNCMHSLAARAAAGRSEGTHRTFGRRLVPSRLASYPFRPPFASKSTASTYLPTPSTVACLSPPRRRERKGRRVVRGKRRYA